MAKPVFVIQFPSSLERSIKLEDRVKETFHKATNNEYHLLLVFSPIDELKFECFNPDIMDDDLRDKVLKIVEQCNNTTSTS